MSNHQQQIIEAAEGRIIEVLSSVPLAEVDALEVNRIGAAGVMEIHAHGSSFTLGGKAGDMKEFAAAFDRARATA